MSRSATVARRPSQTQSSPVLRLLVGGTEMVVGIGGLGGGAVMIANPTGIPGIEPGMLTRTPFDSLTGPGLLLLLLNGLVPLTLGVLLLLAWRPAAPLSLAYGLGLVAWIAAELVLLDAPASWLQPLLLVIGVAVTAGAWALRAPR